MKAKLYFLIVILSCFLLGDSLFSTAFCSQEKHIEVFIKGKRYGSFFDYKVKRLKTSLKMLFLSSGHEDFNAFRQDLLENYTEDAYDGISKKILTAILDDLDPDPDNLGSSDTSLVDIKEMQGMLNNYNRVHKSDESIIIDPDKMKTIIINPSEKR